MHALVFAAPSHKSCCCWCGHVCDVRAYTATKDRFVGCITRVNTSKQHLSKDGSFFLCHHVAHVAFRAANIQHMWRKVRRQRDRNDTSESASAVHAPRWKKQKPMYVSSKTHTQTFSVSLFAQTEQHGRGPGGLTWPSGPPLWWSRSRF